MRYAPSLAESGRSSVGLARGRASLGAVAMAGLALAAVTGCSSGSSSKPLASSSAVATIPATPAATTPTVPATPVPPTPATPASPPPTPPPAAAATLGQPAGDFAHGSSGFGQVKPSKIFNGGDPTGLVTKVVWSSWGGAQATATGTSDYVGPNQSVAQGTEQSATVVAFNLGTCDGKLMYQAVEWYFPQHGQAFNPNQYENICTGTYVGQ
jgi:hypothetical protein